MELRVLKYFLMTAREENITKAAELLHITQPTLSRQLMQLEEELGTKLFIRGGHNVTLTEDGILVRKESPLAVKECVEPGDLLGVPLFMVKRDIVRNEIENWFGEYYEKLNIAGSYNLLNNAAIMVKNNIGAALCFQLNNNYDDLTFVPLSPALETGCVLVWQKNRIVTDVVKNFLDYTKQCVKGITEYV